MGIAFSCISENQVGPGENLKVIAIFPAKRAQVFTVGLPDKPHGQGKRHPPIRQRPFLVHRKKMADGLQRFRVGVKGVLESAVV
ncbi:MAG: hypothetical protein ACLFPD_10890 [Desulfosudaceae bacterium]